MSRRFLWLVATATFLAGVILGFLIAAPPATPASLTPTHPEALFAATPAASKMAASAVGESASGLNPTGRFDGEVDQAIRDALALPSELRRRRALAEIVSDLPASEVTSAVSAATRFNSRSRDLLLPMLLARWAETAPQAAAEYAFTREPTARHDLLAAAMDEWLTKDADTALAWIGTLGSSERSSAVHIAARALAANDPKRALELIGSLPGGRSANYALGEVFAVWAESDPLTAVAEALKVSGKARHEEALESAVVEWAQHDPQRAITWASQLPTDEDRDHLVSRAYAAWSWRDAPAATRAVMILPDGKQKDDLITSLCHSLEDSNPQAALELANQIQSRSARQQAVTTIAIHTAEDDPRRSAETLLSSGLNIANEYSISQVLETWASRDLGSAFEWVAQLPEGNLRNRSMQTLAQEWAKTDPKSAAEYWLKSAARSGVGLDPVLTGIAKKWATTDPNAALAWTRNIVDEAQRSAAVGAVISSIVDQDARAGLALYDALPAQSQVDAASAIAERWAEHNPDAAAQWAFRITNPAARAEATRLVIMTVAADDPGKALQWLGSLPATSNRNDIAAQLANTRGPDEMDQATQWIAAITDPIQRSTTARAAAMNWLLGDRASAERWIRQSEFLDANTKRELLETKRAEF